MEKERNNEFDDVHDIEKHIMKIHSKVIADVLSDDLLLGELEEKERTYVARQVELAHEADHIIVDEEQRKYAVSKLLLKGVMVVILKRNSKSNALVQMILNKRLEEAKQMEEGEIDRKLMEKLEKEKK